MENSVFSDALLTSRYVPNNVWSPLSSPIPIQVYDEILSWLHPKHDPDTDNESYQEILKTLSLVCNYFARYAARESWRCLDFVGLVEGSWTPMQAFAWLTSTSQRFVIAESQRAGVKEFTVHHWNGIMGRSKDFEQITDCFLIRFPRLLSTLDNLEMITLSNSPITYSLLQTIGRLRALKKMVISACYMGDMNGHYSAQPMFGSHEKPFSALHELTIEDPLYRYIDAVFADVFCALVREAPLRSLAISSCYWMYLLLPHISDQLVSLSGNFSTILSYDFLNFIKTHPSLQQLTICSTPWKWFLDHEEVDQIPIYPFRLEVDDLPNLRSFSGPFYLAPDFLYGRSVTRLALGCHLPAQDSFVPLTSLYGLTVFPHTHTAAYGWGDLYLHNHHVWDRLEVLGGGVQELFVRFGFVTESPSLITLCFPYLVHLQVEPWSWSSYDFNSGDVILCDYLSALGDAIKDLHFLEILTLSDTDDNDLYRYRTLWLSPGDQHNFVHRLFKQNSPTLKTIVFSPWMVWHLRKPAFALEDGEYCCDLELLSTKNIRAELRRLACYEDFWYHPVRDWNGKLAGAFRGEPFGWDERVQGILTAMLVDTCSCA